MTPAHSTDMSPGTVAALIFCLLFFWAMAALWGLVAQLFEQWRVERKNKRAKAIAKALDEARKQESKKPFYGGNR